MSNPAKVNWYGDKVRLKIGQAEQGTLLNAALRIEERTKVNINQAPGASGQGLIDTGFMINSVYTVAPQRNTYDQTDKTGTYTNRQGQQVKREIAPEAKLPSGAAALVAVGAEYAIYQEIKHGFFFKAIEDTAVEFKSLVETF